jgi:hypothetical protein
MMQRCSRGYDVDAQRFARLFESSSRPQLFLAQNISIASFGFPSCSRDSRFHFSTAQLCYISTHSVIMRRSGTPFLLAVSSAVVVLLISFYFGALLPSGLKAASPHHEISDVLSRNLSFTSNHTADDDTTTSSSSSYSSDSHLNLTLDSGIDPKNPDAKSLSKRLTAREWQTYGNDLLCLMQTPLPSSGSLRVDFRGRNIETQGQWNTFAQLGHDGWVRSIVSTPERTVNLLKDMLQGTGLPTTPDQYIAVLWVHEGVLNV